ncbi:MAG: dihydropteroate synthase, partial [Selenomonadaceae bacterium]
MRTNWQIRVLDIKNKQQAAAELSKLDCDPTGTAIMQEKAVFKVIRVEKLDTKAANVLKQTFLGKGGEVAVSRHSADLSATYTDVLLMGTLKQYRAALNQLKLQPWGLKGLAEELGRLLGCEGSLAQRHFYWRDRELLLDGESSLVMGILNITPDSFSDGGRYNTLDTARRHLQQMQEDGADIVDIGAESTRPYNGGKKITAEEEQQRLLPMLEKLLTECSVPVSVDTYKAATAA